MKRFVCLALMLGLLSTSAFGQQRRKVIIDEDAAANVILLIAG